MEMALNCFRGPRSLLLFGVSVLLFLLILPPSAHLSAAVGFVFPRAFLKPVIPFPQTLRILKFSSAAQIESTIINRGKVLQQHRNAKLSKLNALLEAGPALPPSQHAGTPPLFPTALQSGADVWSHLLHFERKIFLWGPLTDELAGSVAAQLLTVYRHSTQAIKGTTRRTRQTSFLENRHEADRRMQGGEDASVELIINSRGGSLAAGLALYDVLGLVSSALTIHTLTIGTAGHLASLLLAAGAKGCRAATQNARIFLCASSAQAQGSAEELLRQAAALASQDELFEHLLSQHIQKPQHQIAQWRKCGQVFTAEEAKTLGLIDKVVENKIQNASNPSTANKETRSN